MKKILKIQLLLVFMVSQFIAFGQEQDRHPIHIYQAQQSIQAFIARSTGKIVICDIKQINKDWLIGCPINGSIALFEAIKNPRARGGMTYWTYTLNDKAEQIVGSRMGKTSRIKGKSENNNIDIEYAISQFQ